MAIEQAGEIAISKMIEDKDKRIIGGVEDEGKLHNKRTELEKKIKDGTATPADIDEAKRLAATVGKNVDVARKNLDPANRSTTEQLVGGITSLVGGDEARQAIRADEKAQRETLQATTKELAAFAKTIADASKNVGDHKPPAPQRHDPMTSPNRGGTQ